MDAITSAKPNRSGAITFRENYIDVAHAASHAEVRIRVEGTARTPLKGVHVRSRCPRAPPLRQGIPQYLK